VGGVGTNPTHYGAQIAEKVTVERGESPTNECELGRTVVGEERVGVLQEGDQYEPVVHPSMWQVREKTCLGNRQRDIPKIRHKVQAEHLSKSFVVDPGAHAPQP
jgi:hypothetical protein